MQIAMITSGFLPVPASKGGAVENLIENILKTNEKNDKDICFTIFSIYDENAKTMADNYKNSEFIFIKVNKIVQKLDLFIYSFAKNFLKKKNSQSYRFIIQRLYYLRKVSNYLKKNNYSSVILENHPTQYLALKWHKNYIKYKNNYFYHCHNEFPGLYGCEDIIRDTKKFICVSQYIAKSLANYLNLDENKFIVLKNCVDENKFNKASKNFNKEELLTKYQLDKNKIILLFSGRIVREKGIVELLDSLNYVKNKNYQLLIVGAALNDLQTKTDFEIKVEKMIEKNQHNIRFTGYVNYDDMPNLYKLSDIAVLPSIWNDPAPLTVIESITSGLPVITTNSGGIPEYVSEKCAKILNKDKDLEKTIADAIDQLIDDKEMRKEMGIESIKISKELTINNYYYNFKKIMEINNE